VTSSNACNKSSSQERPVEPRDISRVLYGCLHEDPGEIPPHKGENPRQPCFVMNGVMALVAPGAEGFFELSFGSGGKLRVRLSVGLRGRTPRGLP